MNINELQKKGLLQLISLLVLIIVLINLKKSFLNNSPKFKLDNEIQQQLDLQKLALKNKQQKRVSTYYVNNLTDYSGYQLGLSVTEIDRLLSHLQNNNLIYTLKEFQNITKVDSIKLKYLKSRLRFPKKQPYSTIKTLKHKKASVNKKFNLNTITKIQLEQEFKLPHFIAKRIIKYRYSIGGFKSISGIEKVYGLRPYQIRNIKEHCFLK